MVAFGIGDNFLVLLLRCEGCLTRGVGLHDRALRMNARGGVRFLATDGADRSQCTSGIQWLGLVGIHGTGRRPFCNQCEWLRDDCELGVGVAGRVLFFVGGRPALRINSRIDRFAFQSRLSFLLGFEFFLDFAATFFRAILVLCHRASCACRGETNQPGAQGFCAPGP